MIVHDEVLYAQPLVHFYELYQPDRLVPPVVEGLDAERQPPGHGNRVLLREVIHGQARVGKDTGRASKQLQVEKENENNHPAQFNLFKGSLSKLGPYYNDTF